MLQIFPLINRNYFFSQKNFFEQRLQSTKRTNGAMKSSVTLTDKSLIKNFDQKVLIKKIKKHFILFNFRRIKIENCFLITQKKFNLNYQLTAIQCEFIGEINLDLENNGKKEKQLL